MGFCKMTSKKERLSLSIEVVITTGLFSATYSINMAKAIK